MTPSSVPTHVALTESMAVDDDKHLSTSHLPLSSDASSYSPYGHPPSFSPFTGSPTGSQSPSVGSSFPTHHTARTVYLGNVAPETPVSDILDHIHSGLVEAVRPLPEKNCVFVTFVDAASAAHFYHQALSKHISLNEMDLKVGWGKPKPPSGNMQSILQTGITRNVFLGSLSDDMNEQMIRDALARFGDIEHLRLIREKNIAFVHFLSIADARKCVSQLQIDPEWQAQRVSFGKDRCAPSKIYTYPQTQPAYHALQYAAPPPLDPYGGNGVNATTLEAYPVAIYSTAAVPSPLAGVADRTLYLGNIHPDATCEDICNVIRGGILSQIRYLAEKHIAFVTFVDPALALQVYSHANYHGLVIKNRRLKVGWGKPSGLPAPVMIAVQNGGSRNVYLGNIDDTITEEKLRQDFSEYGDVELVNTLKEKNCAFVNFTNIAAAMRAIEGIRSKDEYKKFRINYGKDRCGNAPRPHKSVSLQESAPYRPTALEEPLQPELNVEQCEESSTIINPPPHAITNEEENAETLETSPSLVE